MVPLSGSRHCKRTFRFDFYLNLKVMRRTSLNMHPCYMLCPKCYCLFYFTFLWKYPGIRYIIALGEIYRVVQVIGASAKLYKPWVLLYTVEPVSLFFLLNECTTLWSTSGLDEALQSISEQIDTEFDGTLKELLESMKYIHDLDALVLQNHVFSGNQPLCRLSMLTAGIVPGMWILIFLYISVHCSTSFNIFHQLY